ncbi:four helix bundle protein [Sphingobacterium griseoflavum]|uniref:Four helix bundle protein n=1 Tax=Sphingobacterium griseoflavum TaxID=1474952 RepID=A0ABQ3HZD5_9SPHI|nr:four helix bundle protein [Sphingobacterium griseoflavum]GHE40863.1 four helix bundle protein [Sphingobacterium griseoflavum]
MHKVQDLRVWQNAMQLAVEVYKCTEQLPQEERFGLLSQVRRSAVSICSNIAEGAGRNSNGEFVQFLGMANGSAYELQTQIELLKRLEYLDEATKLKLVDNIDEIQKMLFKLMKALKNKNEV